MKGSGLLHIVGECDKRIFGLTPAERLSRQLDGRAKVDVVAQACAVLDDGALNWLLDHPNEVLASSSGRPLAVAVQANELETAKIAIAGGDTDLKAVVPEGERFVRKLRRRVELDARSLDEESLPAIEKWLFANVYKGVTDVVTKHAWPWPAYHVTRFVSRFGITPNVVTLVGVVLVFVAGWSFYVGELGWGLAAAWFMTFLDTVDGKLARVTMTSSPFGNFLDHGTDIIHPPIWWYCLAHGLAVVDPGGAGSIWPAFWIVIGCYVVGRMVEITFHRVFGFNQFIWKRFDSQFRLIVSRRNIILLIMTIGLIVGATTQAFLACAAWSIVSTIVQIVRIGQAYASRPIMSWLY